MRQLATGEQMTAAEVMVAAHSALDEWWAGLGMGEKALVYKLLAEKFPHTRARQAAQ